MEKGMPLYRELLPMLGQEGPLALATIVAAEGATPQTPGAAALFSDRGLLLGTLGGGILEADAGRTAVRSLQEGHSAFFRFDLRGEELGGTEPVCGGSVWVLIDSPLTDHRKAWRLLGDSLRSRRGGLLVTRIERSSSERAKVQRLWIDEGSLSQPGEDRTFICPAEEMTRALRTREPVFIEERPAAKEMRQRALFIEPLFPPPRLLIVGAGHIGRALAPYGSRLDFEVTVIDDRAEYANRERFPAADALIVGEIGRTARSFPVSSDTYVVIVTRGHSHDAEALRAFVRSPAAYVGMIGSRHKVALMKDRFLRAGWATAQEWDRVHTPIGLKIGSKTVEEIALSIAAEIVQVRSRAREPGSGVNP